MKSFKLLSIVGMAILASGCRAPDKKPLVDRLTDVSYMAVRIAALNDLTKLPPTEKKALVLPLALRLENPDRYVRQNAGVALGHIGPLASEAIPALQKAKTDKDEDVRRIALVALARMGQDVDATVQGLIHELQTDDAMRKYRVISAISALGDLASAAALPLVKAIHDKDPHVQVAAAQALTTLGTGASAVVPQLIKELDNPNRNVRHLCSVVLRQVDTPEARAALKDFRLDL